MIDENETPESEKTTASEGTANESGSSRPKATETLTTETITTETSFKQKPKRDRKSGPQTKEQPQQKSPQKGLGQQSQTGLSPKNQKSYDCRLVEDYMERYVQNMSKPVMTTKGMSNGATLLHSIISKLATSDSQDAFDAFYDFMVKHKDSLMSEKYALRGVDSLDPTMNTRVSIGYRLFRQHVVSGNIDEYNKKAATDVLGGANIITYLNNRNTS